MPDSHDGKRIERLEEHLRTENPVLAEVVPGYRRLDGIARRLGVLDKNESFSDHVPWWPVVSVLGTYSAGKSTFLNQFVGTTLQRTGNQAVDDKFTVICYGEDDGTVLPGRALDSDPRLPFYGIGAAIENSENSDGRSVDSYIQLKTCQSEWLRGKIVIDSPGFDADEQRSSTLLLADHIIDLSDLVLVFFDARHPEPRAMADTLEHLVTDTISRADANKFLYVLNQIDNAAREDNPEEVVAAWQRALAKHGLTAGRFYRIYARDAAPRIEDDQIRERMERKRDEDLEEIATRINQVEVERAYRVVGRLEESARFLRDEVVPQIREARRRWKRRTLATTLAVFGALIAVFVLWSLAGDFPAAQVYAWFAGQDGIVQTILALLLFAVIFWIYVLLRRLAGGTVERRLRSNLSQEPLRRYVLNGFAHNRGAWWHAPATSRPRGWTRRARRKLTEVLKAADRFVQSLNDKYATPSGSASRD